MAEISIGSAVGAGFQLIARKPLAVIAWGALRVAFAGVVLAIYAPILLSIFAEALHNAQAAQAAGGADAGASQAAVSQMMSHLMVMQGAGYLAQIVGLFLSAVIYCAICRAVVHPERSAFAYLRLGAPEFYVAVISFAASFVAAFAIVICMIPFVIVVVVLAAQKLFVAMTVVIALGVLVLLAALIYVLLRFAFVIPMMVDDGQFHLFDAWSLTKGHVASLFVIGLCLVGLAIAAELVLATLGFTAFGAAMAGHMIDKQSIVAFLGLGPAAIAAQVVPWLILAALVAIPVGGCVLTILLAPWARAYRDVAPPPQPVLATPPPAAAPPTQPSPAVA
jgi:hypothetical protein